MWNQEYLHNCGVLDIYRRVSVAGVINDERERKMTDQNNHRIDVFIAVEQFHLDCHRNSAKEIPLLYIIQLYSSLASRLFHEVCGIRHKTFYDASPSPSSKLVCFRLWFGLRVLRCCSTVFQ